MLRDMPGESELTPAHDRLSLVWDAGAESYALGAQERPAPITSLPARFTTGREYVLTRSSPFQPWFEATAAAGGTNDPVRIASVTGTTPAWTLIRYANAQSLNAQIRNQTRGARKIFFYYREKRLRKLSRKMAKKYQ